MIKFRVLNEDGIGDIHNAAISMLETIGMDIAGSKPRAVLLDAGAKEKDGRILISGEMVDKALSQVPKDGFELFGRDTSKRIRIAPGHINFRPAGGPPFVIDYSSGERRNGTMTDAENIAKVADALDGIDIVNSGASPADIGVGIKNVYRFVNAIRSSTKPTDITASGPEEVAAVHEISVVIRGSQKELERQPLVKFYVSPTSPLRLSEQEALATMECASRCLPLAPLSCPILAATAPATIAGGIAQAWAEQLAMIVLAYIIRPGLPIIACSRINPVDMHTGNALVSGPIIGLATSALTELAASVNLPSDGWGFASSSQASDLQAGAERMSGSLFAALSGTSVISGAGTLENALITTPQQLVIDNEIIGFIRRTLRGVEVSQETLGGNYIADGVREGTFMTSQHTIDHLRSGNMWVADIFSTEPYETWEKHKKETIDRATERVEQILKTHTVEPIEDDKLVEIDSILKASGA